MLIIPCFIYSSVKYSPHLGHSKAEANFNYLECGNVVQVLIKIGKYPGKNNEDSEDNSIIFQILNMTR